MSKQNPFEGSAAGVPTFSVIMPAYNTERFVDKALDSLVQQHCQDFEVVFIDDGSTDDTASVASKILSHWGGSYTFLHQENQGVGRAKNNAIKHAKGKYLFFLDSDDIVDPEMLEQVSHVVGRSFPDVVATGWRRIDEEGEEIEDDFFYHSNTPEMPSEPSERIVQFLKGLFPLWIGAFLVKRSLVEEKRIEFFSRIPVHDDVFFMLRCLFHMESYELIDKELSSYRKRKGSITLDRNYEDLVLKAEIHLMREVKRLFDGLDRCPGESLEYCNRRLTLAYFRRLKGFVMEGREDLFSRASREGVFRSLLSDMTLSGSYSANDRFKAFLALFSPALYRLRYRIKGKKLSKLH